LARSLSGPSDLITEEAFVEGSAMK
jgi:hypothetical protein